MTLDKFVLQFLINNDDAIKKAKQLESALDSLDKKSQSTKKSLSDALNVVSSTDSIGQTQRTIVTKKTTGSTQTTVIKHSESVSKVEDETRKKRQLTSKQLENEKKKDKQVEKSSQYFKDLNKGLKQSLEQGGLVGFLKSGIFSRLAGVGTGVGIASWIASTTLSEARKYNPLFYDQDRLNTSAANITGLSRALNLTGTSGDQIISALGLISRSQTMTHLMGAQNVFSNVMNSLNVPLSNRRNQARKPEDILLNIAGAVQSGIKAKHLNKQDAYNMLELAGFSPGVVNFLMQGPQAIRQSLNQQSGNISLTKQQIENLNELNKATQNLENQFSNLKLELANTFAPFLTMLEKGIASFFTPNAEKGALNFLGMGILAARRTHLTKEQLEKQRAINLNAERGLLGYPNGSAIAGATNVTHHNNVQNLHVHTKSTDPKGIVNEIYNSMGINNVMQSNLGMY